MRFLVTVVFFAVFVAILQTESRMIAFAVLGVLGAAILAALIDSTHSRS